jgi:hypothetical protein
VRTAGPVPHVRNIRPENDDENLIRWPFVEAQLDGPSRHLRPLPNKQQP